MSLPWLAACWLWEWAVYRVWARSGWRAGRLSTLHYRAEARLRRVQGDREEAGKWSGR